MTIDQMSRNVMVNLGFQCYPLVFLGITDKLDAPALRHPIIANVTSDFAEAAPVCDPGVDVGSCRRHGQLLRPTKPSVLVLMDEKSHVDVAQKITRSAVGSRSGFGTLLLVFIHA